jgi:PrsW family intramembrane metalloprotease/zinc-ribbon domain
LDCPRCGARLPEVAHFCQVCGLNLISGDGSRRKTFAAKPDEPVASFALISSIMPHGAGQRPQTYRIALTIALAVALIAAIFGAVPIAVLVAAFAIPIVYIVYLYDANLWEDEPVPVVALAFGLTGVLAIIFTIVWTGLRGPIFSPVSFDGSVMSTPTVGTFLLVAVLVPIIGEAIRQVGPIILARRPEFDDLMDGLTFGVVSGVAYATFDTIVKHWDLLASGVVSQADPGLWIFLIFLEGFVKPLIIGTATGIACAEFSGLGRGYDGFTARYVRGLAEAILANVAYQAGTYLFSFIGNQTMGVILSVLWGLVILAILILRVRNVLHVGLMEAALERSARGADLDESGELQFCAQCEMPVLARAAFCNACGTAVRVQSKEHKTKALVATAPPTAGSDPAATGSPRPAPAAQQERPVPIAEDSPPELSGPDSGQDDDGDGRS